MAAQQGSKGNPASHRMGNKNLIARRERCWRNGQKRKEARRAEASRRQGANIDRRAKGELTPWEQAKLHRSAKRALLAQARRVA